VSVLICDTRVKHELSSSEYNLRRAECREACDVLGKFLPQVGALRDVSVAQLEQLALALPEVLRKRARHVVTENARTLMAAEALGRGDLSTVGALMSESHTSLRNDYQVSCDELDVAVDTATAQAGVYGSRMTGGGFGGCTVTLVDNKALSRVIDAVKAAFAARGWREPELFASKACEGARRE
jgi:galactokinase